VKKQPLTKFISILGVIFTLAMTGCASTEYVENERDPWQGFNRTVYGFNDTLDQALLKPAAKGYQAVAPDFVETGVRNFFSNINDVSVAFNNLLQGKVSHAFSDVGRVLFNTTLGLLGLFDVASDMGMQKHNEDFGQTLATWGVDSGPYLMLPFFGPSTLRDSTSVPVDKFILNPINHIDMEKSDRMYLMAVDVVSVRAELLSLEKTVDEIATDKYSFIREAYLDRRHYLVHDGAPPEEESLYEGLDEE
jgi:phospholipid-binding lipoprotein MlaA